MKKTPKIFLASLISSSTLFMTACSCLVKNEAFTCREKADYHTVCNGISSEFNRINGNLEKYSAELEKNNSIKGPKTELILDNLRDRDSAIVSVGTINPEGKLEEAQPSEYSGFEGKSLIKNANVAKALKTGKPVLSDIYNSKIGTHIVEFLYPVKLKDNKTALLSMLVRFDDFIENAITDKIKKGESNIIVMQKNGIVLYSGEKGLTGINTLKENLHFKQLNELAEKITKTPAGKAPCHIEDKTTGRLLKAECIWTTAGLYSMEWRVALISKALKNEKK